MKNVTEDGLARDGGSQLSQPLLVSAIVGEVREKKKKKTRFRDVREVREKKREKKKKPKFRGVREVREKKKKKTRFRACVR
jgi:hypothetical protein